MTRETLLLATGQSATLFLVIWAVFRLVPSIPANAKAWIWRLAFLKPLASLLPFAIVTLYVLPAPPSLSVPAETTNVGFTSAYHPSVSESAGPSASPFDPLLALWILGVAGVAAYGIANWLRARQTVRNAVPITDERIQRALKELTDRADFETPIRLLASSDASSAILIGGIRPTILLPAKAVASAPLEDIRLMLAHEVAHLVRRDLTWFGLIWAVQSLFFFNPLVWVAARCSRLDHESATDRHASRLAGVPIQTYAEMLLRATVVARPPLAPGTVPMAESYRSIHRRLEAMKHFNSQPSFWRKSAVAALALATVGLLPSYQLAEASPTPSPAPQGRPTTVPPKVVAPKAPKAMSKRPPVRLWTKRNGKKEYYVLREENGKWVVLKNGKPTGIVVKKGETIVFAAGKADSKTVKVLPSTVPPTKTKTKPGPVPADAPGPKNGHPSVPPSPTKPVHLLPSVSPIADIHRVNPLEATPTPLSPTAADPLNHPTSPSYRIEPLAPKAAHEDLISLNLDKCDVREALRAVFRHTNKSFEIDVLVQGTVTISLTDATLDKALRAILRPANGTYRVEDGVYIVTRL